MDKVSLRTIMRAVGPVPSEASRLIVNGIFSWMSPRLPGTVSSFLAMEGEVDLEPLMQRLPGWRWVLPRVETDGSLTFRDASVPRETHSFGMDQPMDSGPVVPLHELDILLVPGLAFDRHGRRLGNGAGHYDRVLSGVRTNAESVGIAPISHVVDSVPATSHDRPVGWLATEHGMIRCSPNA